MKRRIVLALLSGFLATAAVGCGTGGGSEFPIEVTDSAVANGREVYAANCARCHGFPGDEPPLAGAPRHDVVDHPSSHTWHHTDRQLFEWILDRPPLATVMPAFRGTLTEEQVRDVIAYIKSGWPEDVRERQESFSREYETQIAEFGR